MLDETHIASLVVQARPEDIASVASAIAQMEGVEIHAKGENGKLVVVLEAPGTGGLADMVSAIEQTPSVVGAQLIYHHIDDDDEDADEPLNNESTNQEKILSC